MEAGGGGAAVGCTASLDAFFSLLESELRHHLRAFVEQEGCVAEIASPDVRLMLKNLAKRWDDHGGMLPSTSRGLRLEGSPIIAANFSTINTVLNLYHHKSTAHWEVIEQGVDCAVRLLRALHTYAGIDTQQGVGQLLGRWEAVEKVGPFAYDHTVKVAVEDITDGAGSGRASGSGAAPRLLLRNLPAEATASAVVWALMAQDVEVEESMVHLGSGGSSEEEGGDESVAHTAEPFVELKSIQDQQELLALGTITIKRTRVELVKPEETREVVLYLPKKLPTQVIAGVWENEFDHVLAVEGNDSAVECVDAAGHVMVVRLTPEQFAQVEGKVITLLRAPVRLLPWCPERAIKLQLPSAEMSTDSVRSIVLRNLADADSTSDAIEALVHLATQRCAFVHLASAAAKAQLLQKRHLDASESGSAPASPVSTPAAAAAIPSMATPAVTSTMTVASAASAAAPTPVAGASSSSASASMHQDQAVEKSASPASSAPRNVASEVNPTGTASGESGSGGSTPRDWKMVVLSPLPVDGTASQVAELVRVACGIDAKLITIAGHKAFVRYQPSSGPATLPASQVVRHNDVLYNVDKAVGELPCRQLGLRSSAQVGKSTFHAAVLSVLQSFSHEAPFQVGRYSIVAPDVATIEIGTEALFSKALAMKSKSTRGVTLTFFDAELDRTEPLDDPALVYYLTAKKKGNKVIKVIENANAVAISAWWTYSSTVAASTPSTSAPPPSPTSAGGGVSRTKVAFARIVGESPKAVDAAWKQLCAHLATVVRRRAHFKFDIREEALLRSCFKRKLTPLFWKGTRTGVYVEDGEDGAQSLVVVHIVGADAKEAKALALEPNHIRTRLVSERSRPMSESQLKSLDLPALEKEFGVVVAADWSGKQLRVAGFREEVRDCLAKVQVASSASAAPQAQAAAATSKLPVTPTPSPQPQAGSKKTPPKAAPAPAMTKTIMFTVAEEVSARKLDVERLKIKFGLASITVGLSTRTITFVGPDAPSLNKASSFVRWFIDNGTNKKAGAVPATPPTSTTSTKSSA